MFGGRLFWLGLTGSGGREEQRSNIGGSQRIVQVGSAEEQKMKDEAKEGSVDCGDNLLLAISNEE